MIMRSMVDEILLKTERTLKAIDETFDKEFLDKFKMFMLLSENISDISKKENSEQLFKKCDLSNGIKPIFELDQIPITVLFKIWKGVAPEEYHQEIDRYLTEEDFDIVLFVRRMITRSEPESYDKFCKLFDKNTVFYRIKDVDANSIPDYYNSVGFFIERYNSKEDASK